MIRFKKKIKNKKIVLVLLLFHCIRENFISYCEVMEYRILMKKYWKVDVYANTCNMKHNYTGCLKNHSENA